MRVAAVVVLCLAFSVAAAGHWKHWHRKRALWGHSHAHSHGHFLVPPYKKGHDIPVVTHSVLRPLLGTVKLPLHQPPPDHFHHHHHHVAPRPIIPVPAPVVPLVQQALLARPALPAPVVVPLPAPAVPVAPPPAISVPAVPQYSYVLRPGNAVQTSYFATFPRYPVALFGRPAVAPVAAPVAGWTPAPVLPQHLHQVQLPLQQQLPYHLTQSAPHPVGYDQQLYQHQLDHEHYHHQQLEHDQHYHQQLEHDQHYHQQLDQQQHYQHQLEQQHYHQQLEHEHQYHQQLEQEHQYNHQLGHDHQLHEHQLHQQQEHQLHQQQEHEHQIHQLAHEHQLHDQLAHEHQYHQQLEQEHQYHHSLEQDQWSPMPQEPHEGHQESPELRYHNHIPLGLQPPLTDRQDHHRNDTDTDSVRSEQ